MVVENRQVKWNMEKSYTLGYRTFHQVAIYVAAIQVLCHAVKSLQLIWTSAPVNWIAVTWLKDSAPPY